MIGFFLKKAFYKSWDNIPVLAALNAGFVLLIILLLGVPVISSNNTILAIPLLVGIVYLFYFYAGGVSMFLGDLTLDKRPLLKHFPGYIAFSWKIAALLGTITNIQLIILTVGLPFYSYLGGIFGIAAMSVLFWGSILWGLISLWILPVHHQENSNIITVLKKSAFFLFDNIGFSIFISVYSILLFLISIATAFIIPGISAILYNHQLALKLRMYKYQYIENNELTNRNKIPWDSVLITEKEKLGPRSLKGLFFPWKG